MHRAKERPTMAVKPRDVKDVSHLVTKKLEMYMNRERRENRFDPTGPFRTTPKMHKFDFMYKVLEKVVLDQLPPSGRNSDGNSSRISETQSTSRQASNKEEMKRQNITGSKFEEDSRNTESTAENEDSDTEKPAYSIKPKLQQTSRSVVLHREAERLANYANKVFEELPLKKLQLIHRHRPAYSHTVPDKPEFGKCQGYSRHVGAVLHSDKFVDYYVKEGLHLGMSKRKDLKESQKFRDNTDSPRETMKRSRTDLAIPRQTVFELGLYRTKTRLSRTLASQNKPPPSKRSLDSTTISEFSNSVRSDPVSSRPLSPAQKRFDSNEDKGEIKETETFVSGINGYQKNDGKLDMHSINGNIKLSKYVLQKNERTYPKQVKDKYDQEKEMPRDYNEHSIFEVNASTGPGLSSVSLESSTTPTIPKEYTHSSIRQITVSEAPKAERTSTPISPKEEKDYTADKTGNVRTLLYDAEPEKLGYVSLTEVKNNPTHKDIKQERNEPEGETSDMKDTYENVEETIANQTVPDNTEKTKEAEEITEPPKIRRYADISQRNTAIAEERLIKNEKSDIAVSTESGATGEEQREMKSNFDGFAEICRTYNSDKEKTPAHKYPDELRNSLTDTREQQHERILFKERVIRDIDEIKEARQEKDAPIKKNRGNDDEINLEEEHNYRKISQDNIIQKLPQVETHEVELLSEEENISSEQSVNDAGNRSQTLKHQIGISDIEQNETDTEQHIGSGLGEDSLSSSADSTLLSFELSNNNTDKTDLTVPGVNNSQSSETEQVEVLFTVTSSAADSSEDIYSKTSSSEDDASKENVSDLRGRQTENIGNTRGGKLDENIPVEEICTNGAENNANIQPKNEHVQPNVDDILEKPMDDIIHEPDTVVGVTNDIDVTMGREYNIAVESVQSKQHNIPEKYEKEQQLEQKAELEPYSIKDSETRKSPETEDQTADEEVPKEIVTDVKDGILKEADEESNTTNMNKLVKQEWQEEKSEKLVEEIIEEHSQELESGIVYDKDVVDSGSQEKMNSQDETDEPLRKKKDIINLNQESVLTVSTHAETDVETKPLDSINISRSDAERRLDTPESAVRYPDTNEGQYDKSKELREPSVSEEEERMAVKETGELNGTQKLVDDENILTVKIIEKSPKVIGTEKGGDSKSANETPGRELNDTESYTRPESVNFDHSISIPMDDSNAEGLEYSPTQAETEKDHFKIGFESENQINARSSGISQIMVKETDPNDEDRSDFDEPKNHQAVVKNAEVKTIESKDKDKDAEDSTIEQELQDPKEQHGTRVVETVPNQMDATSYL